jgi:saccharopine dehydrogenase-like NADP-dependent oxidoreductase
MLVAILGAGKIGVSIAALLETAEFVEAVILGDTRIVENLNALRKTRFQQIDIASTEALESFIRSCDAVVSAAPFYLNKSISRVCAAAGCSYFDLTEDVETTRFVRELATGKNLTFMPQCGLAPGAINIIGSGLAHSFKTVSWSTAGLINEYCQLGEALYQGQRIPTTPLDGVERLTIDGVEYEAFNTSGGVATMCETFQGRIADLNYKTLRYPGHRDLMKFLLYDLNLNQKRDVLTQIFDQEVPLTFSDVVVIYANRRLDPTKLCEKDLCWSGFWPAAFSDSTLDRRGCGGSA